MPILSEFKLNYGNLVDIQTDALKNNDFNNYVELPLISITD